MMCLVEGKQTNDYCHAGREASQVLIAEIRSGYDEMLWLTPATPIHWFVLITSFDPLVRPHLLSLPRIRHAHSCVIAKDSTISGHKFSRAVVGYLCYTSYRLAMGCVSSRDVEAVRRTQAIDQQLASQSAARRNEIKLLLLGEQGGREGRVQDGLFSVLLCDTVSCGVYTKRGREEVCCVSQWVNACSLQCRL